MINFNENVNMTSTITATNSNGKEVQVLFASLSLEKTSNNFSINVSMIDKDTALLNKEAVQVDLNSVIQTFKAKMQEVGFIVTI